MSIQPLETHELRAQHNREIDRIEREHTERLALNAQHAYTQGYEDGLSAGHWIINFTVGVLCGVGAALTWPVIWRAVAGFFSHNQ